MSEEDFHQLVRLMRAAQTHYFKVRTREALLDAKSLEARVDKACAAELQTKIDNNLSLFPQDEGI